MKNWSKTTSTEARLGVIGRPERGKQNVEICHNVRLTRSSIHKIHDIADRIIESAKSGTKMFV